MAVGLVFTVNRVNFGGIEQRGKNRLDIFFIKANGIAIGKLEEDRFHRFDQRRDLIFLR